MVGAFWSGGADENRTRIICLEDRGFTTKLQPRIRTFGKVGYRLIDYTGL